MHFQKGGPYDFLGKIKISAKIPALTPQKWEKVRLFSLREHRNLYLKSVIIILNTQPCHNNSEGIGFTSSLIWRVWYRLAVCDPRFVPRGLQTEGCFKDYEHKNFYLFLQIFRFLKSEIKRQFKKLKPIIFEKKISYFKRPNESYFKKKT